MGGDHDHSHHHDEEYGHNQSHNDVDTDCYKPASSLTEKQDSSSSNNEVQKRLYISITIVTCFLIVEVIGGIISGSLAVLSDAAHLLADLTAFIIAIAASHISILPPTQVSTFGFKRTEALAALLSMFCLALVTVMLAVEGIRRSYTILFGDGIDVDGKVMSFIAGIGVFVNIALAFVLKGDHVHLPGSDHDHSHEHDHNHDDDDSHSHDHSHSSHNNHDDHSHHHDHDDDDSQSHDHSHSSHDHSHDHKNESTPLLTTTTTKEYDQVKDNLNLNAAYMHVLGDLLMSIAVLISGLIIWYKPQYQIVDPICTLLFAVMVFKAAVGVVKTSISILLNEVPMSVNWSEVELAIKSLDGVYDVHDLHIWSISHGVLAMSVHCSADNIEDAIAKVHFLCETKFGVEHTTIQVQPRNVTGGCIGCKENNRDSCVLSQR